MACASVDQRDCDCIPPGFVDWDQDSQFIPERDTNLLVQVSAELRGRGGGGRGGGGGGGRRGGGGGG